MWKRLSMAIALVSEPEMKPGQQPEIRRGEPVGRAERPAAAAATTWIMFGRRRIQAATRRVPQTLPEWSMT